MLILSILIYAYTALLLSKWVYKEINIDKYLIVFFLTIYSVNVLVFEVLAIAHRMSEKPLFLLIQVLFCSAIVVVLKVVSGVSLRLAVSYERVKWGVGEWVIFTCIAGIMGGFFVVGMLTSPNNLDSLATHILRIYYWLQHGSLASWPASTPYQLYYPVNAHFQGAWLFLLGGSEKLFFLVQWSSYLIILVLTYEIGIFFGNKRVTAMFCALLCLGIPVALLQTYSFQGDLTVAALILGAIYFLFSYRYKNEPKLLFAGILSLTLALGTKQTAYFTVPVLIAFAFYWLRGTEIKIQKWTVVIAAFAMIGLFSVNKNIQNIYYTGKFFGEVAPNSFMKDPLESGAQSFLHNFPRYLYSLISFDGLPLDIYSKMTAGKAIIGKEIDSKLSLQMEDDRYLPPGYDANETFSFNSIPPLSEDTSWTGLVGFLILPAGMVFSLFSKEKRTRDYAIFAITFGVLYLMLVMIQRPGWDPYQGRYFILGLLPGVPLAAALVPKNKPYGGIIMALVALVVLGIAVNTFLFNESKHVLSKTELTLGLSRSLERIPPLNCVNRKVRNFLGISLRYLSDIAPEGESIFSKSWMRQVYISNQSIIPTLSFISNVVPKGGSIYLYNPGYLLEFGLFEENATRKLIPINSLEEFEGNLFLITKNEITDHEALGLTLVAKSNKILIYH